jgi:hypothetical protein
MADLRLPTFSTNVLCVIAKVSTNHPGHSFSFEGKNFKDKENIQHDIK